MTTTDRTRTPEARAEAVRRSMIRAEKYGRAGARPSALPTTGYALRASGVVVPS
jgi:hypothetical protein